MGYIPQVHLTNHVRLKGQKDVKCTGSSFLIAYNNQIFACTHAELLTSAFGVNPGIKNKNEIPDIVTEWILSPRIFSKGFFIKKSVIENPMRVIKYLNLNSPSKILLMDVNTIPKEGNYTGIRLSGTEVKNEMTIMVTTCPSNRKDTPQEFYFGHVISDDADGLFAFVLDEKIAHRGVSGSPVGDSNGGLIGMIVAFTYVEEQLIFFAERITQLKKDLLDNFGESL